jgi:hypothetical protein
LPDVDAYRRGLNSQEFDPLVYYPALPSPGINLCLVLDQCEQILRNAAPVPSASAEPCARLKVAADSVFFIIWMGFVKVPWPRILSSPFRAASRKLATIS